MTFGELECRSNRLANALLGVGLEPGDHVGVVLANVPEYIEIGFGLAKAGLVMVPISYRLIGAEMAGQLNHGDARALIVGTEYWSTIEEVRDQLDSIQHRWILGDPCPAGLDSYEEVLARASDTLGWEYPAVEETAPFFIAYTSGTTAAPKGVTVSHRSRVLSFFGMAAEFGCYTCDDISVAVAPLYHGAGMAFALAPLYFGGTISLLKAFSPEVVLQSLADHRATNIFLVPTMFHAILALPESVLRRYDSSALRVIISNAAALPQQTKELIVQEWPGSGLFETYGLHRGRLRDKPSPGGPTAQDPLRGPAVSVDRDQAAGRPGRRGAGRRGRRTVFAQSLPLQRLLQSAGGHSRFDAPGLLQRR